MREGRAEAKKSDVVVKAGDDIVQLAEVGETKPKEDGEVISDGIRNYKRQETPNTINLSVKRKRQTNSREIPSSKRQKQDSTPQERRRKSPTSRRKTISSSSENSEMGEYSPRRVQPKRKRQETDQAESPLKKQKMEEVISTDEPESDTLPPSDSESEFEPEGSAKKRKRGGTITATPSKRAKKQAVAKPTATSGPPLSSTSDAKPTANEDENTPLLYTRLKSLVGGAKVVNRQTTLSN
ncbi:hypothetical protein TWF694_008514 [Orbilia ellipsospora]|uniref:Uncharacterized protein n=1 Tax=Orbilia ellipsospora TaxID=2528407 RepID=A0AAV9XGE0_9PEZI